MVCHARVMVIGVGSDLNCSIYQLRYACEKLDSNAKSSSFGGNVSMLRLRMIAT